MVPSANNQSGNNSLDPNGFDLTKINQEIYQKNAELVTKNTILSTLRDIYEIINKSLSLEEISQHLVSKLISELELSIGLILIKTGTETTLKTIAAKINNPDLFLEQLEKALLNLTVDLNDKTNPIASTMQANQKAQFENISPLTNLLQEEEEKLLKEKLKLQSLLIYPFNYGGQMQGIIVLGSDKSVENIPQTSREILDEVVYAISIGLQDAYLFNQSVELTKQLSEKNNALTTALETIKEVQRRERDMIDIMGHELRTPITIVRNALSLLKNIMQNVSPVTPQILNKYIDMANESAEREISIIETLLSATKVDSDHLQIFREKVDFIDVVNDSIMALKSRAERKSLGLIFNQPTFPALIYADRTRIQEVMDNLLSNAIKYTEQGHVEVKLEDLGEVIKCSIIDTGVGIPQEDIKNLGKKFYRVKTHIADDMATIVRPGGTGLGLYVTFAIVAGHGGKVFVQSEIGKGSIFSYTIPKYKDQPIEKSLRTQEKDLFKRMGLKNEQGQTVQQPRRREIAD